MFYILVMKKDGAARLNRLHILKSELNIKYTLQERKAFVHSTCSEVL